MHHAIAVRAQQCQVVEAGQSLGGLDERLGVVTLDEPFAALSVPFAEVQIARLACEPSGCLEQAFFLRLTIFRSRSRIRCRRYRMRPSVASTSSSSGSAATGAVPEAASDRISAATVATSLLSKAPRWMRPLSFPMAVSWTSGMCPGPPGLRALIRAADPSGGIGYELCHPPIDRYPTLVADRARPSALRADGVRSEDVLRRRDEGFVRERKRVARVLVVSL